MKAPEKFHDPEAKAGLYAKLDRLAREFAARDAALAEGAERPPAFTTRIGWVAHWHRDLVVPVVRTEDGAVDVERLADDVRAALDAVYAEA